MKGINSFKHVLNFISNTEVPDAMKVEEEKEDDEDDLWFIYSFYLLFIPDFSRSLVLFWKSF